MRFFFLNWKGLNIIKFMSCEEDTIKKINGKKVNRHLEKQTPEARRLTHANKEVNNGGCIDRGKGRDREKW